jgi:hypothetical protein
MCIHIYIYMMNLCMYIYIYIYNKYMYIYISKYTCHPHLSKAYSRVPYHDDDDDVDDFW